MAVLGIKTEDSARILKAVLNRGIEFLSEQKVEPAKLLAEWLLEGLLSCKRFELYLNAQRVLSPSQIDTYFSFLRKRIEGIPSQYILGHADFMDFTFQVNPSVLIPRPETEFLVEKTVEHVSSQGLGREKLKILDLGTGSGNIAVSLASYLPKASLVAVDISDEALEVARLNAMRNEVSHRIRFLKSDFFEALPTDRAFDLIVSNPPYLSRKDMEEIAPEVSKEPALALFGGEKGTEFIERFAGEGRSYLKEEGFLFFEIGASQGNEVTQILKGSGWTNFEVLKDYSGFDRVVKCRP